MNPAIEVIRTLRELRRDMAGALDRSRTSRTPFGRWLARKRAERLAKYINRIESLI